MTRQSLSRFDSCSRPRRLGEKCRPRMRCTTTWTPQILPRRRNHSSGWVGQPPLGYTPVGDLPGILPVAPQGGMFITKRLAGFPKNVVSGIKAGDIPYYIFGYLLYRDFPFVYRTVGFCFRYYPEAGPRANGSPFGPCGFAQWQFRRVTPPPSFWEVFPWLPGRPVFPYVGTKTA